jgi:hypothetical protein
VVDHGFIRSVYFTDPNGIALEASYWVVDGTGRPTDYSDPSLFGDPDPVPAMRARGHPCGRCRDPIDLTLRASVPGGAAWLRRRGPARGRCRRARRRRPRL